MAPPESFFETVRERDRQAACEFYVKFVDVQGLSVVAGTSVADEALRRSHDLVTHLLAGRPDILQAMVQNGTRLIIIGKDQVYTGKFTNAREFVVLGSQHASDAALLKANDTIRRMFAYRHDILKALIADGARLVVLGRDDKVADLPEFKSAGANSPLKNSPLPLGEGQGEGRLRVFPANGPHPNPLPEGEGALKSVFQRAARADLGKSRYVDYSPGNTLIVVPEENILGLAGEPFAGQCLVIGALAKTMHRVTGLRPVDPDFDKRRDKQQYELRVTRMDIEFDRKLEKIYDVAMSAGLWNGTPAAQSRVEYLAAGVQAYFDAAGESLKPELSKTPITTREAFKAYDPDLFALVEETMAFKNYADWRFKR
jgi:hypothetical protein